MEFNFQGTTIFYSKVGQGPHLCFLHGFCEDRSLWDPIIRRLQSHYTCLSIDLPGFGESAINEPLNMEQTAELINAILSELNNSQWSIFGHSMGGYIALEAVRQKPEIYTSLGLIHSTAFADSELKKENRQRVIDFVSANGARSFLKEFYPSLVHPLKLEQHASALWELVKETSDTSITAATKAMMERKDQTELLRQLKIPVLFVIGESDPFVPRSDSYLQMSYCDRAQLDELESCGHLSMWEDPEACTSAISSFLNFVADSV